MPTYSLQCQADTCATQFDVVQSFKADLPVCPACGAETKRIITSVPAVSFKGIGWSTDNYSVTQQGAQRSSDKADKKDRVVSFPGQKGRGREGA